jgi:hypothetical protein
MGIKDLAISYVVFSTIHLFLFALALTTIGLYGTDLHNANKQGKYSDSKWVSDLLPPSLRSSTCKYTLLLCNAIQYSTVQHSADKSSMHRSTPWLLVASLP